MKRVYLVRHGETTHNLDNLVQDGTPALTDRGKRQAFVLAERLNNLDFQNIVVSDYVRTLQTVKPIEEFSGLEAIPSELFREVRRPSVFTDKKRNDEEYRIFLHDEFNNFHDENWRHSDEESFAERCERAKNALALLRDIDGDTVVVSHGHFILLLVAMAVVNGDLSAKMWQHIYRTFIPSNTGITTILYDDEKAYWKLLTFNDFAHFAE